MTGQNIQVQFFLVFLNVRPAWLHTWWEVNLQDWRYVRDLTVSQALVRSTHLFLCIRGTAQKDPSLLLDDLQRLSTSPLVIVWLEMWAEDELSGHRFYSDSGFFKYPTSLTKVTSRLFSWGLFISLTSYSWGNFWSCLAIYYIYCIL